MVKSIGGRFRTEFQLPGIDLWSPVNAPSPARTVKAIRKHCSCQQSGCYKCTAASESGGMGLLAEMVKAKPKESALSDQQGRRPLGRDHSYRVTAPQRLGGTERLNPIEIGLASLSVKVLGSENASGVWVTPISHPRVEWVEVPAPCTRCPRLTTLRYPAGAKQTAGLPWPFCWGSPR